MQKKLTWVWLLLGLGSKLQLIASLSITELIVFISAPFILFKAYPQMKRDGVAPFWGLSILVIIGCVIASIANKTELSYVMRGLAVTCLMSCSIIFSYWLIRRDPGGFKWYIIGMAFSMLLSTFIFKQATEVVMLGESSEAIMGGPIFWINRLGAFASVPTVGWYLHMPWIVNVTLPLFMAVFAVTTSTSGRGAALRAICFVALVIIGGKTRKSMSRISRHFALICVLGFCGLMSMYLLYKVAAQQNWLAEGGREKYERQTQGGQGGIGRLILGGRGESLIGLLACRDKPIIGWGPWAVDQNGYAEEFIERFGTVEDLVKLQQSKIRLAKSGILYGSGFLLSCHAYITEFWAWYGIFGLIFWLYVIFVLLRYLKQDVNAVPHWFAWLACSVPGFLWNIFFNPLSERFGAPLFVVACLMARAVRKGSFRLPYDMILEVEKVERN